MNIADKLIEISTTRDLQDAIAAGYQPQQLRIVVPEAEAVAAQATADAQTAADAVTAAERAAFEREREGWNAERNRLVAAALEMSLPEQTLAIQRAERSRILTIQGFAERGFESTATEAIESGITVEAFAMKQLLEMKDRGITLAAIGRDAPMPAPHAAVPTAESKKRSVAQSWESAFAQRDGERN